MNFSQDTAEKTLQRAISETFELLTFTDIIEYRRLDKITAPPGSLIGFQQTVTAPFSATIGIILDTTWVAATLEETFAEEYATNPNFADDFVAEITNTISGSFLKSLLPVRQEFNLGLPQKLDIPTEFLPVQNSETGFILSFDLNNQPGYCFFISET